MPLKTETLFPPEPLLLNRLGAEVFDSVPTTPGIYRFYDREGNLLYVGKAKNLRRRIFTYKQASSGSVSGKVARMIGRIGSFDFEETETEMEALLLENRWIREKRPPFNHANKQTEAYYYVYIQISKESLEFRLAMRIHEETEPEHWHGSFKGHRPVRIAFGRMLQLLWMAENRCCCPHHLPVQLTRRLTPMRYTLYWNGKNSLSYLCNLKDLINRWITGEACELLDLFNVWIGEGENMTPFQARYLESGLETLRQFYERKLVVHRKLQKLLPEGDRLISQECLDDYLARISHTTLMESR
ncbi:nucleotide excision repair endonuclease [Rhodohalobacter sp. SW132]|uniref:nucleotide excision repair endonuclease n=1 Tax=Rhodohalobacter sp. SW132 TaxID=2293433 RepID=UPI000E25C167|nr:nucleotide excision repair endonuclease [Rhodohalobacter sp. SW132]REL24534.1 nucleotide excision repair endonuclease [Rhodohalobacter sp. SW132]